MTSYENIYNQLLCTFKYHLNLQLYESKLLKYEYYNKYLDIDDNTTNKDITNNIYQILNDMLKLINNLQHNKNNLYLLLIIYQHSIIYYEYQLFQLYTCHYNNYIIYNNNNNNNNNNNTDNNNTDNNNTDNTDNNLSSSINDKLTPIYININKRLFEEECLVCYKIASKCKHFISGNCTRKKCSFCHCV